MAKGITGKRKNANCKLGKEGSEFVKGLEAGFCRTVKLRERRAPSLVGWSKILPGLVPKSCSSCLKLKMVIGY
jgi:hypothetical protein